MDSFAQSILMDAPMAIVAINECGIVYCANATAKRFFGRSQVAPRTDIRNLIEDFDVGSLKSPSAVEDINALSHSGGKSFHRRARRFDGQKTFVDVQATRFSSGGKNLFTLFIQDMTASVAAETALQDVRIQILRSWRSNSLGEVASMLAHELNQPLGAAVNYLAAADAAFSRRVGEAPEVAEVADMMHAARNQVERASDIIRHLRSLLTHDKGFQTRENLAEVIDEIMPILHVNARETGAEVVVRLDPADFTRCDRVQLQQVVINLVRNAMDAPPNGALRKVELSGRTTSQGYLMVVSDNGPGVPPEMADKLFVPLASSKPGGMGLGLSICRTIIEAHGGAIDLAPSPLGGAAFAFTLNANVHDLHLPGGVSERNLDQNGRPQGELKSSGQRA